MPEAAAQRVTGRVRSLALVLLLLLVWIVRPIGPHAPGRVDSAFDTQRALARLAIILGDQQPHPTGTPQNDAVAERLVAQIRALGFVPELRGGFHCSADRQGAIRCAQPRNIAFWVGPPGDDAVMLAAHYDSVPAGPGASDDGMGVAAALEIAHLLKATPLARPVLVLITDAEEAGLIGAAQFAAYDPLAAHVGAVVNLEARGTTGSANMFQTSTPNGRDIAALKKGGLVSSANALATDLYRILPNDTDLTMLLPRGYDAVNYAIIGGGMRYHTPRDDLAHLDPASLQDMGANALAAVQGFIGTSHPAGAAERSRIFTNIGRWALLVMPVSVAILCLGAGFAGAGTVIWSGRGRPVRTALVLPAALIGGTALALAIAWLLAAVKADAAYGTAWPVAPRLAFSGAALFGATLIVRLMSRDDETQRITGWAWLWLAALVALAFMVMPGLSTMAAWPLMLLCGAGLAASSARARIVVPWLLTAAALLFMLIALPIAGGLEDALFVEQSAPGNLLLLFMLLFLLPLIGRPSGAAVIGCALAALAGIIATLALPAFSYDAPRHLSVVHEDRDGTGAILIRNNGPLPPAMRAAASFAERPAAQRQWHAPAPRLPEDGTISLSRETSARGINAIHIHARSPASDRQEFHVENGEGVRAVIVNGVRPHMQHPLKSVSCAGRSCRDLTVTLLLDAAAPPPRIKWRRIYYGAGEWARQIIARRPDHAVPVHLGDSRMIIRSLTLP